jgi:hypothetical protein
MQTTTRNDMVVMLPGRVSQRRQIEGSVTLTWSLSNALALYSANRMESVVPDLGDGWISE